MNINGTKPEKPKELTPEEFHEFEADRYRERILYLENHKRKDPETPGVPIKEIPFMLRKNDVVNCGGIYFRIVKSQSKKIILVPLSEKG